MTDTKKSGGRNLNFLFIVGLILAILTIIFAIQNSETTRVEFFRFEVDPPTALLIISCIAVGSVLTLLFSVPGLFRRRKVNKKLHAELAELQKRYDELAAVQPSKSTGTATSGSQTTS